MDMQEFDGVAIRSEDSENIYLDLRPFANLQTEALDLYLDNTLNSVRAGASTIGERPIVLFTDPAVPIAESSRNSLVVLRNGGISISVQARR